MEEKEICEISNIDIDINEIIINYDNNDYKCKLQIINELFYI